MAKRNIIRIDEEKCNGCGQCIPDCPEGALQVIDGKARLISDLFCDGLGACIGSCPQGAISVEEREAVPYDERKVMANIVKQGRNVIKAHLEHLKAHKESKLLAQAMEYLAENKIDVSFEEKTACGCPGSKTIDLRGKADKGAETAGDVRSQLKQWPLQLALISPQAPYYQKADLLLAADCTAYALGDFHGTYLKGKALAVACPKLDQRQDMYVEKIKVLIDEAGINTLTVLVMQVPCCSGLLRIAQTAVSQAKRKVPLKSIVVGLQGEILKEKWL